MVVQDREPTRADHLVYISVGLETLIELQNLGATNLPDHLQPLDQADFRTAALGMFVELGELVNESSWKPWRRYDKPSAADRQRVLKELADVLHFLPWMIRNLQARFDFEVQDVAQAFIEVHEENIRRFRGQVPGREPPLSNSGWKNLPVDSPKADAVHQAKIIDMVLDNVDDITEGQRQQAKDLFSRGQWTDGLAALGLDT